MNTIENNVTLARDCGASGVSPSVRGDITGWPVWAARALVAAVAAWDNTGWPEIAGVTLTETGTDAGGAVEYTATPTVPAGRLDRKAGARWQAALEAVLAAQA
jgi:hypothetical protein